MGLVAALLLAVLVQVPASAQRDAFGRPSGFSGEELLSRFDADGDGALSDGERRDARAFLRANSRRPSTTAGRVAPRMPDLEADLRASAAAAPRTMTGLYDESTLRTLYLRFPNADWFEELADFYGTDIDVPADLVVDGKLYPGVGVRFRGNSSYQMTGGSLKKSFNVSVDYRDGGQRLLGYRTLNLLNAANDPSFVREVLYNRIARSYLPALRANFVKLVINGESWGVYVNVQQFNADFIREWFGSTDGNRWKVPAGGGAGRGGWGSGAGFVWLGAGTDRYRISYELKSADRPEAWRDLVRLCQVLEETPEDRLEAELAPLLDIDGALWFLALENVFVDGDGYLSRGSDFSLYQDAAGRFHLVPYDSNETFRWAGGGGPNDWGAGGLQPSPLAHTDSANRPLARRLLSLPSTRARYLAHVRTIVEEWLDWKVLGPIVAGYRALIDDAVEADDKKLFSSEAFRSSLSAGSGGSLGRGGFWGGGGAPGLEGFVAERRAFLAAHEALRERGIAVAAASGPRETTAAEAAIIVAEIAGSVRPAAVLLHWSAGPLAPFRAEPMARGGDGRYTGRIPAQPAGTLVRWYVETRTAGAAFASSFWPSGAERAAPSYRVKAPIAASSAVRINEVSAAAGRANDWIELVNTGTRPVDLAGMFLSDDPDVPRRWAFPAGTVIPAGGYVVVRAGDEAVAPPALAAGFGLSAGGETLLLVDADARGNTVLDSVTFGALVEGTSIGRLPDGSGPFRTMSPTPGKPNGP